MRQGDSSRMSVEEDTVVANFGSVYGTPISNKDTIMEEINERLGKPRTAHPKVSYILTRPFGLITLPFGLGSINYNTFGHSALRYTTPEGKDVVVNVEAKEYGKRFIQVYDAKEYFFGTEPEKSGAQKGVYHRDMVELRVEDVSPQEIEKMHNYILQLMDHSEQSIAIAQQNKQQFMNYGHYRFNLFFGPLLNLLHIVFPHFPEYGNCARWTSAMLMKAGLTTNYFVWPSTVFINMFENYRMLNIKLLSNMNVIYYEQPNHVASLAYGVRAKPVWFEKNIAPLQSFRNWFYSDLKHFANVIVKVPANTTTAVVEVVDPQKVHKPNEWRNVLNSKYFIVSSVVGTIVVYRKGWNYLKQAYQRYRTTSSSKALVVVKK